MPNNNTSSWVGVGISALLLLGGSVAAYVDVKSDIAIVETKVDGVRESGKELDKYDAYLQRQVDANKNEIIKGETKQEGYEKNQERLERTMDAVLIELKKMNENIVKLQADK